MHTDTRLAGIGLILVLCLVVPACAQQGSPTPEVDLPVFPGGETTLEVNLTSEDVQAALEAALPLLGNRFALPPDLKAEDVAAIFAGIRRIQVTQVEVRKKGVSESDVAAFYAKNLPAGNWNRVFWQAGGPMGSVALYVCNGAEGIYGFRIDSKTEDGQPVRRALVGLIEGHIDFTKLLQLAARLLAGSAGGQS